VTLYHCRACGAERIAERPMEEPDGGVLRLVCTHCGHLTNHDPCEHDGDGRVIRLVAEIER
jgi:DNA-directed RNA polymerase subunit RPC12/RpoP